MRLADILRAACFPRSRKGISEEKIMWAHGYACRARSGAAALGVTAVLAIVLASNEAIAGGTPVAATPEDFVQPGTQPLGLGLPNGLAQFESSNQCVLCHSSFGEQKDPFLVSEPHKAWVASMMGQSARDPLFYAGMTIANQDVQGAGEYCMRCHVPVGWLNGHATVTDGSALEGIDLQGVQCNFCHRMVDPEYKPGISPSLDEPILTDLANAGFATPDGEGNNARYVIDPVDVRRGPYGDILNNPHPPNPEIAPEIVESPFHTKAEFCWTCHGVSNMLVSKNGDGTYSLNELDAQHPTHDQHDMFPLHRTYGEWKNSYYSSIGVQHNGRFGGNHPTGIMKDCQDCHMPDIEGKGCALPEFPERPDIPQHSFMGANTWVINAVRTVDFDGNSQPDFPDSVTALTDEAVNQSITRTIDFLERASDLTLSIDGSDLNARLTNRTGHKLPTGFPDGRRIWINVKFLDCNGEVVQEHGAYDFKSATLTMDDTKVYEIQLGIQGAEHAAAVGHPEGPTMHFMLANAILRDNRIPPAGHSNTIAQQMQTMPVGAVYANGQHWDDTLYEIPSLARSAVVTTYYQVTSKEFIEHLRDDNVTDNRGQVAYDLWVQHGMSSPVAMDMQQIEFPRPAMPPWTESWMLMICWSSSTHGACAVSPTNALQT